MPKKLFKSKTDKKIAGVCGGLGKYLDIDPSIIRLIWASLVFFAGTGLYLYIIAALILPFEEA
jgi:phage shock protein PspC (stress-responsive transcriptional regulator)